MNRWLIGGLVGVWAGVGAYLMVSQKETPQSLGNVLEPPTVVAPPPSPPAPIVLSQVIETTDLDPLLDPPAKPLTGMPFDVDAMSTPVSTPTVPAPDRIPPAADDLPGGNGISIFGYQLGTDVLSDAGIKTVFVHTFANSPETGPFRGIEVSISAEAIRQIEQRTPFKVVPDSVKADTELICNIVSIQKNILNATSQNATREFEVVVSMDVAWRDLRTGEILSAPKKPGNPGVDPSKTPQPEPIRIVASGRYIMELGETAATGAQRAKIELATQIVAMMEKQW
ncbi:MAG TPA: LPS assembly lipoprotein LptE [Gemmata sp.]|jgi:hypothetical protein|nr:LPS assembly lipoprotein LptE [Gemmata sp.]